ncbi:MAG: S41 family peptidase, partial [Bacteroidota bacterium]
QKLFITLLMFLCTHIAISQSNDIDHDKIKEDLNEILSDLSRSYVYLKDKNVNIDCIRTHYESQIPSIETEEQVVLFFEYLLDEFYDSHLILNTNRASSFRLFSPIYASIQQEKVLISSVWQNQIENLDQNIVGAEILKINKIDLNSAIEQFPTHCSDKASHKVREWIANKVLAGRYNQPRVLTLKLKNGELTELDLSQLKIKQHSTLLTTSIKDNIGIITIQNSLGNNSLIGEFDDALDELMDTKGLIIDLRNTVDGGNSYVARGIMGRFISEPKPYQKHLRDEQYGEGPAIERSWIEYVSPRRERYEGKVVVLVGRWTGSMGEGLAIGFEGMERAIIVGTEMERLAGEMSGFSFRHQNFGYRLSTARLFHVNGTPREKYVPENYVKQTTIKKDEALEKGLEILKRDTK